MLDLVSKLKQAHQLRTVEKKDFPLKDLFTKNTTEVILNITGFASSYVSKYHNETNEGFHTMVYTIDEKGAEKKTGAFSNALYSFACFFYDAAGLTTTENRKILFDKPVIIRVSKIELEKGKTTYDFEIIGGEAETFQTFSNLKITQSLIGTEKELPTIEGEILEAETAPATETETAPSK